MRLRKRPRFDTLQNEIRKRGRSWGRWIYIGVVVGLFAWVFDLFVGNMVYFRAEGLVLRDRVVIATQYTGEIIQLLAEEGHVVRKGQVLAQLRSQSVEESFAKLYAELAGVLEKNTQLAIRSNVIEAVSPMATQRAQEAHHARLATEELKNQKLLTIGRRSELLEGEIRSAQLRAQLDAEKRALLADLPDMRSAVVAAQTAVKRLQEVYDGGRIVAPADGIIGYLHVSEGSVVKTGEPLMEIFKGEPYVLAYVPEGALYTVRNGDSISVRVGFSRYKGEVSRVLPVAGQLPKEFQNTFQPVTRAQLVRIDLDAGRYPPLFAKTKLSSGEWPPSWLSRMFADLLSNTASAD